MADQPKKIGVNFALLEWATLFCLSFVGFRIVWAGMTGYIFLIWNLFLAWIPLFCADAVELFHQKRSKVRFWLFGFLWLIFFPNAPYIVTDFTHLDPWKTVGVPVWFDFGMVAAFALTGILLGLCSLQVMQKIVQERFQAFWSWFFITAVSLLTGFGIYLGRYLRWNSWDILFNPQELFKDIGDRLIQPIAHPVTWFISLLFASLVISSHLVFSHFCEYRSSKKSKS